MERRRSLELLLVSFEVVLFEWPSGASLLSTGQTAATGRRVGKASGRRRCRLGLTKEGRLQGRRRTGIKIVQG